MGCSGSKEDDGVKNQRGPQTPPAATEPTKADAMPGALLSAIASSKTNLHTLTTEAATEAGTEPSFYGYKGGEQSSASIEESNPPRSTRSEGFTDTSLFSTTSSKRSGGFTGYSGEKLSEQSDEEDIEDDFEDIDEGRTPGRGTVGAVGSSRASSAKRAGVSSLAAGASPAHRSSPSTDATSFDQRWVVPRA